MITVPDDRLREMARMVVSHVDVLDAAIDEVTKAVMGAGAGVALAMWQLATGTDDEDAAIARARLVADGVREAMR